MPFPAGWKRCCPITIPATALGGPSHGKMPVVLTEACLPNEVLTYAANALANPGFETGNTAGWTVSAAGATSTAVSSAQKHSGTYSLQVTATGVGSVSVNQTLACSPGQLVTASCWMQLGTGLALPCSLDMVFHDAGGQSCGRTFSLFPCYPNIPYNWSQMYLSTIAPSNAASVLIEAFFSAGIGTSTSLYLDDLYAAVGSFQAQLDGGDLRFSADSAGMVPLSHELVLWSPNSSPASAKAEIWVNVPSLSAYQPNVFYLWYAFAQNPANNQSLARGNDCANGSFDLGTVNFASNSGAGLTVNTSFGHAAAPCCQLATGASNGAVYAPDGQIPLASPGQQYQISCWIKADSGANGTATIIWYFSDASGNVLVSGTPGPLSPSTSWQFQSVLTAAAPAGTAHVGAIYCFLTANTVGNWYVDECSQVAQVWPASALVAHFPDGSSLNARNWTPAGPGIVPSGMVAGAGKLDGAGYVNGSSYAYSALDGTGLTALTVDLWFSIAAMPGSQIGILSWGRTGTDSNPFLLVDLLASGVLQVGFDSAYRYSSSALSINTWYKLTITWTGTVLTVYLNGVAAGTYTVSNPPAFQANATLLFFGTGFNGFFTGYLDEVRVHPFVVDPTWVYTDYLMAHAPASFAAPGAPFSPGPWDTRGGHY